MGLLMRDNSALQAKACLRMWPAPVVHRPAMALRIEVLPAPLGPTISIVSLCATFTGVQGRTQTPCEPGQDIPNKGYAACIALMYGAGIENCVLPHN